MFMLSSCLKSTRFCLRSKFSFISLNKLNKKSDTIAKQFRFLHYANKMELSLVTKEFNSIAPLNLAESWDNVGLLVEPCSEKLVSKVLFTNDLTMKVLDEALDVSADVIYSYHPPIFSSLKRLQKSEWKHRIILTCIENRIAIYSPHTALDARHDGVNDWLISCFDLESSQVIHQSKDSLSKYSHQVEFKLKESIDKNEILTGLDDVLVISCSPCSMEGTMVKVLTDQKSLVPLLACLSAKEASVLSVVKCEQLPLLNNGMGRIGKLSKPVQLAEAITIAKNHVKAKHIRVSFANNHMHDTVISSVAVCAGSGSSILKNTPAQLYITGEMGHHDLLDAAHQGSTVILCEHSNSERGFLKHITEKLQPKLPGIELLVSKTDADPVTIV